MKGWAIRHAVNRAITLEEEEKILADEHNPELHAFYELLWHLGGSQTDMAMLRAEDIDWPRRTIAYGRQKTDSRAHIHFGDSVVQVLRSRPATGCLFPMLAPWKESDRAKAFTRRCRRVGISGVSLHSYRYACAERARSAGYPERFAQEALGQKRRAIHHAYAENAQVEIPPLEDYEKKSQILANVIALKFHAEPDPAAGSVAMEQALKCELTFPALGQTD